MQKFSERLSDKWEVDLLKSKEKHPFYRVWAVECGLTKFCKQGELIS